MYLPVERVNDSQRAQILSNLGYTEESLKDDLERIRLWMKTQDHFPPSAHKESKEFLEAFLVFSKNLENCKKKLDSYYSLRSRLPHLLCYMDPLDKAIMKTKDEWLVAAMPKLTPEGQMVCFMSHPDYDPSSIYSCTKRVIMMTEAWFREGGMLAGGWLVSDVANLTLAKISPPLNYIRDFYYYMQEGLPAKIVGIIIFNVPSYLVQPINILLKPFLSKKMCDRIIFYPDEEGLLNHFPLELIPQDYGGKLKSLKELSDICAEATILRRELFLGPLTETTDEKRRLHPRDDNFNGYFRTLEID